MLGRPSHGKDSRVREGGYVADGLMENGMKEVRFELGPGGQMDCKWLGQKHRKAF